MLRSKRLGIVLSLLILALPVKADDNALWQEYGLIRQSTDKHGKTTVTVREMKDLTGALAAWEWLRSPNSRACTLWPFCTQEGTRTVMAVDNYVLEFEGAPLTRTAYETLIAGLPNRKDTSLPAILTFLPVQGRKHDSARYILGPASLSEFAPELKTAKPGFEQGAEAQVAAYQLRKRPEPVKLAIFYYATPEMARLHVPDFKLNVGPHVKRSGVLVAMVLPAAGGAQVPDDIADTLLSRVGYEAKITWNDIPPPSLIKPMYSLLVNILVLSGILGALCITAGLFYASLRIYRRRYGTLEADEAMTTLHLSD